MKLKLVKHIGNGGFGRVDEVVDSKGNHYARKTFEVPASMPKSLVDNVKERFKREITYQSRIKHNNIVPKPH
jgi:serine/threonine protein kinase